MQEIDVTARSEAAPDAVYRLLTDGARWPECSPLGSFELERPGDTEREGVGAVRVFRTGRVTSREEIVEADPGRRYAYVTLSGMPLVGYRADIALEPDGTGTLITWHSGFRPKYPGTGWFFRLLLGGVIRRLVAGLAASARPADRPG